MQHRQEGKVATVKERERAAAEITVTTARAARLAMAELAAARVEVEAAVAVNAARAAATELETLHSISSSSSVSADDGTDDEVKLAREAAREQAAQWAAAHPKGVVAAAQTGTAAGSTEIVTFIVARLSLPGQVPWSPRDPGHCQGRRFQRWVPYPHQDHQCRVARGDEDMTPGAAHVGSSSVRRRRLL
jgi:hypothetical protein